jgi:DNA polymerase-1
VSTVLIDADVLCYRACHPAVENIDFGMGDGGFDVVNEKMAYEIADEEVAAWKKVARCKKVKLVFTDRETDRNFRTQVCPHYKANRTGEKPPLHNEVYQYLRANYDSVSVPGIEGDDLLGLLATGEDGGKYVVASIDKDILTLPCRQVNPDKDARPRKVSVRNANYYWMYQTIMGDVVDNYKGAPGAGPKAAERALMGTKVLDDMWAAALSVYADQHDHGRWGKKFTCETAYDEALMNARCARILRHGDFKDGKVRLWQPDGEEEIWVKA